MRALGVILLAAVAGLAACDRYTGLDPRPYTESEIRLRGWAEQDIVAAPPPAYCYRSLAAVECYTHPQITEDYRYIQPTAPVAKTRTVSSQ
jgi:hypothetical protein